MVWKGMHKLSRRTWRSKPRIGTPVPIRYTQWIKLAHPQSVYKLRKILPWSGWWIPEDGARIPSRLGRVFPQKNVSIYLYKGTLTCKPQELYDGPLFGLFCAYLPDEDPTCVPASFIMHDLNLLFSSLSSTLSTFTCQANKDDFVINIDDSTHYPDNSTHPNFSPQLQKLTNGMMQN